MGQGTGTPSVNVNISSNNLKRQLNIKDAVAAIVGTSTANIGVVNQVNSLSDAVEKGYTQADAPNIYKALELFYNELGGSIKVYVMGVEDTMTLTQMVTSSNINGVKKLLLAGKDITHVYITRKPVVGYDPGEDFLDTDVPAAILASKALHQYQVSINRPFRLIIDTRINDVNAELFEPNTFDNTYVLPVLGNDIDGNSFGALALARTIKYGADVKIGDGLNGPLSVSAAYIRNKAIDDFYPEQLDDFANAGFCVVHQREGSAGYYFGRDNTAGNDDFRILVHGNLIDKAQRIATATNTPYLESSIRINADGTISDSDAKYLEELTKQQILAQMSGQISDVEVIIDTDQNLIETSNLNETVKILPKGYLTWITINMGLTSKLS